jgi:signal recognition particle subunit SRP19
MSRRAAIVEEFDDDTDLPLPSVPLPNTGSRGPLLQELHIDDDQFDFNPSSQSSHAGPAPTRPNPQQDSTSARTDGGESVNRVTDTTPYKSSVLRRFSS